MKMFDDTKLPEGVAKDLVVTIRTDSTSMTEKAQAFLVKDQLTFTEASKIAEECARREKRIDERFADVRAKTKAAKLKADEANSAVIRLIDELKAPFTAAKKILDGKADTWMKAENARLAAEAEEKRRVEQKRLDDEKTAKVQDLKASGDTEAALAVELAPVLADVPVETVETTAGSSHRANWKSVCFDLKLLCKAVAEDRAPLDLVEFAQSVGDKYAKAMHEAMKFDGILARDVGLVSHKV